MGVCEQTIAPAVLWLMPIQALGLVNSKTAVLLTPAVVGQLSDHELLADGLEVPCPERGYLCLAQLEDDLLGAVPHLAMSCPLGPELLT